MGTKRPFDEDLQEFIKHPKHLEYGNKPDSYGEDKHSHETSLDIGNSGEGGVNNLVHTGDDQQNKKVITMVDKEFETNAPLQLVTGVSGHEDAAGHGSGSGSGSGLGPVFCSSYFSDFFEFNMPRRQLVHYDDSYSSLFTSSPRKEVPVGPEHQADVPEFDPEAARNYGNGGEERSMGICVIPMPNSISSNQEDETVNPQTDCKCLDGGSIRCVQEHVNEARLKQIEFFGNEKFVELGLNNMGEEVSRNWTEEEEQLFHDVVYSNPVSHGKRFWEQLSIAFPFRTKKELVSYYFNVFILRRRAVQNRSKLLEIDSDDDEWWGSRRVPSGVRLEDEEFVIVGPFTDHGDQDSSSEDGDDNNGGGEGDLVIGIKDGDKNQTDDKIENEQEKPVNPNKNEANSNGLRSESYLHWDPPYSTMGSTKGVDLLPTCSMIEEIFGSSKSSKST